MRVLVGVSGGIAAYKAVAVVRGLIKAGHDVRVIPTRSALRMVGAPTWQALAGHEIHTDVWEASAQVEHVSVARDVDLFAIVPATADLLARLRLGRADDLLTATALNVTAPLHVFPAMHSHMWTHPATQENVAVLRQRGVVVHDPVAGALSSGDSGVGRLADPTDILRDLAAATAPASASLSGRTVVISAGGTREPIDPVRYVGNRSSGRMGCALARAAARAGARVTLVAANVDAALVPPGITVVSAPTAQAMERQMRAAAAAADLIIMAAAVADYRPREVSQDKIKKCGPTAKGITVRMEATPDVLAQLVNARSAGQTIVGFAAETGQPDQVLAYAREKIARKGCDYLVANRVGSAAGFGNVSTHVDVLDASGIVRASFTGDKERVAQQLINFWAG